MDEFDFFMDEDEYAIEEAEEFEALVDHEAGFDCDPYDVESYHAEAMLAYYDQATRCRVTYLTPNKLDKYSKK